ncbi:MAG: S41 family peptidase [Acidobacteriota bacterium]|nr:S41 family peptidase [Acidobacteriota bacterium]
MTVFRSITACRWTFGLALSCVLVAQIAPTGDQRSSREAARAVPAREGQSDPAADLTPALRQFVDVLSTVQSQGADPKPIDALIYGGAIPSMLRELDPHTQFFDPAQFQQLKEMEDSEQKGFGSIVSVLPGQVIFLQTLPGTPSNKAGIQAGDELVAVNNIAIRALESEQIIELLTEARQQRVEIYIRRQGSARPLQFTLTPELVDAPSVDRAYMLQPGFGYIRIASWDLQTAKQLSEAITKLGGTSLTGLVLDLRSNPGGVVKAALDVSAMFLAPGQRILTAKGRSSDAQTADVPKDAKPYHFALAVLINEKTASASEIFSGALQDHDRAVIVGLPSYGKGLVQSVLPLSDGTGLAITTAFYYTPSGRSIQHPLRDSALSETFSDKPKANAPTYKTDRGRVVTGGGGIQPDIRVEGQATTRLETVLDASGVLTSFATSYISTHSPLPDSFEITAETLDELKVYLSGRSIQPSVAEWSAERAWVSKRLKEEIVTQAQGVAKGEEIQAKRDPQIQAALKAMRESPLVAEAR